VATHHASRVGSPTRQPLVEWEVEGSRLRCLVRWSDRRPALSDVLPIFEQLGLDLVDHQPWAAADGFVFTDVARGPVDDVLALMTEAFVAAWEGSVDRDELAVLVVEAQLHARQVQLVRAAYQYLRQAGLGASRSYVSSILATHREFARHWVDTFEQRFDPEG
jgi:glutamate dehydrogenase